MERILSEVALEVQEICGREIFIFKNNIDFKGQSYACHSNFSLKLEFFNRLYEENIWSSAWLSFIATSIIYTGSGRVGYESDGKPCSYQISQRADHICKVFSMDTMHDRPMINFRGEPLADPNKWGRFHVILDDSNMSEWSIYLKIGTKALVLNMLQSQYFSGLRWFRHSYGISDYGRLLLSDPIGAMKFISRDLTCKEPLSYSRRGYSALEIQKIWLDLVKDFYLNRLRIYDAPWITDVIKMWEQVLNWIKVEDSVLDSILDWRIKKLLIDDLVGKRLQRGLVTSQEKQRFIDLHYHNISENGFYNRLAEVIRFAKEDDIEKARFNSSEKTRAWLRSQLIKRFPEHLIDVSWELLIFNMKVGGLDKKFRLEPDPILSTRSDVGNIFDDSEGYEEFCHKFLDLYLAQRSKF